MRFVAAFILFISGFSFNAFAQTNDDVVKAAYAMTHTPTGREFREPRYSDATQARLEKDLEIAKAVMEVAPDREESYHWLGRRYGYLGMLPQAIEVFSEGLDKFPESYRLLRYRARHLARNYQFEQAIADYNLAAEILENHADSYEPNGIANALNITISTFKQNIPYYLAQTSMATGDYETTVRGMDEAMDTPVHFAELEQDVAAVYWKYMGLRKLGRHAEAEEAIKMIPDEAELIENDQYHRAVNYLKGLYTRAEFLEIADPIGKYAIAMKDHFEGRNDEAIKMWREITAASPRGYWPAEAELVKVGAK